jgi:hypothetical protein
LLCCSQIRHCERSEAIQSRKYRTSPLWIASSPLTRLLAMTERTVGCFGFS